MHATPALNSHNAAFFTSTSLRQDGPIRKSLNHFHYEYCLISDGKALAKTFKFKYEANWEDPDQKHEPDKPTDLSNGFLPLSDHPRWQMSSSSVLGYEALLSKPDLIKWPHGLLLKLAVPAIRETAEQTMSPVVAPLNLTIFFRLLARLHETGYPKHWLSGILTDILLDRIKPSARPPSTCPLDFSKVRLLES